MVKHRKLQVSESSTQRDPPPFDESKEEDAQRDIEQRQNTIIVKKSLNSEAFDSIGWILIGVGVLLGIMTQMSFIVRDSVFNIELAVVFIITGCFVKCFFYLQGLAGCAKYTILAVDGESGYMYLQYMPYKPLDLPPSLTRDLCL